MRISFALSLFLILAACRAAEEPSKKPEPFVTPEPSAKSQTMAAEVCLAGSPLIYTALECLTQRGIQSAQDPYLPGHWTYVECANRANAEEPARCTLVVIATDMWQRVTGWRVQ